MKYGFATVQLGGFTAPGLPLGRWVEFFNYGFWVQPLRSVQAVQAVSEVATLKPAQRLNRSSAFPPLAQQHHRDKSAERGHRDQRRDAQDVEDRQRVAALGGIVPITEHQQMVEA